MKEIELTKGMKAIVDDEDYYYLNKYNWFVSKGGTGRIYYAHRRSKKSDNTNKQQIRMHHQIIGYKKGYVVDHINRNGLDNRKENLRHVTHSQNHMNKNLIRNKTSQFAGVCWSSYHNKWRSFIHDISETKIVHLGYFDNEIVAAIYYILALDKYRKNEIGLYR